MATSVVQVKKSNHQVNVVRIAEVLKHPNADKLEIVHIGGYQCVVGKGQFKPGDLAVYVQPDSVVPQTAPFKFIWEQYQTDPVGEVPERRRRVTVRKFRGEWSEGLLLPVTDFSGGLQHEPNLSYGWLKEGDDVSDILGITHYDPDKGKERTTAGEVMSGPRRRYPRSLKGWFFFILHKLGFQKALAGVSEDVSFYVPVYDVEALKNFTKAFEPGEPVVATEKIHGSNARYMFLDGKMYAGSRTLWKAPKSPCVWRKALKQNPWIEEWCRAHEGHTLFGEVTPTQKGFDYGCKDGEVRFFAFDILTPEGEWKKPFVWDVIVPTEMPVFATEGIHSIPTILYMGPFDLEKIKTHVDGPTVSGQGKHIREGLVIAPLVERHVHGLGRLQLKLVSNAFLEKDSK